MTYLIVGVDRRSFAPWSENVLACDLPTARQIAQARAAARGVSLVIAAVIGPNSAVLPDHAEVTEASSHAA